MKTRSIRSRAAILAAGLLATPIALSPSLTTPAHALIVFDPSNYAQNVLTAARSLEQITNQITSLQNQAQSLDLVRSERTAGFDVEAVGEVRFDLTMKLDDGRRHGITVPYFGKE